MKHSKLISMLLSFVFAVSFVSLPNAALAVSEEKTQNILKLMENLNVTDKSSAVNLTKNVTRGDAVKYVVRTITNGADLFKRETDFADVSDNGELSAYVNYAAANGMIGKNDRFYPNDNAKFEEIIKMIMCGLGYDYVAQTKGGYPTGYLITAVEAKVIDSWSMKLEQDITYETLFLILKDTLSAKLCETSYGENIKYTVTNKTLISNVYDLEILKNTQAAQVNEKNNTVLLDGLSSKPLTIPDNYINEELLDIYANIWYNPREEVLVYLEILTSYTIRYDYIIAVNEVEDATAEFDSGLIKNIKLYSDNKKYTAHTDGVKIRYNGVEMTGSIKLANTYARIVFKDDNVSAIESYTLTEGGLATGVSTSRILYKRGLNSNLYIDYMDSTDSIKTVLDGERIDWKKIPKDSVVDYFQSEDVIFIAASTRTTTGNLDETGDKEIVIGGERYNTDNTFGDICYSIDEGVTFDNDSGKTEYLYNTKVTAYLDSCGRVRYIKGTKDKDEVFIGLITDMKKDAFNVSSIDIYATHKGTVGVKRFDVKLSKSSEVKEKDLMDIQSADDAVFKFYTQGRYVIKIENLYWLKRNPESQNSISSAVNSTLIDLYGQNRITAMKKDPHVFITGWTMGRDYSLGRLTFAAQADDGTNFSLTTNQAGTVYLAAYDSLGELNPSMIHWNDYRNTWFDRTFLKVGFDKDNTDRLSPDIVFILSNPKWVRSSWDVFGVVNKISELADDRYMMEVLEPGPVYVKYIINGEDIYGEGDRIKPKRGDPIWLSVRGYFERVNYNALGEIITQEEADELEEAGEVVQTEETYQASGYARVIKTFDMENEVGLYDTHNRITYVDNIYTFDYSLMFYQDQYTGFNMPIRCFDNGNPFIVEGSNKYLMFEYEDFIEQKFFDKSFDEVNTIKKSGFSDKLYIFSVNQGRYPKIVLRMPQDYIPPWD